MRDAVRRPPISAERIFSDDVLKEYFDHSADPHLWLTRVARLIDKVNEFGQQHRWEELSGLSRQARPLRLAERLQYFKDETLLTLYGLVALDLCDPLAGRTARLDELLRLALGNSWSGFAATAPRLSLEPQISPPADYLTSLTERLEEHPVAYVRALGEGNGRLEGATHLDAQIRDADRRILFEAKFLSDISCQTTYGVERNQIARNLDAGLDKVDGDAERLYFVLLTPRRFRDGAPSRLYRYKMDEYRRDPECLRRDLAHRRGETDYETLARHLGWATWEDVCAILRASCPADARTTAVLQFFEERRLASSADLRTSAV